MTLIHTLTKFLTPIEIESISKIPLKGKEALVRDQILSMRESPELDKNHIQKKLAIKRPHLDKIFAILLNKFYTEIVPDGEMALLRYLRDRLMFQHLFHELKMIEKTLPTEKMERAESEQYYREFFNYAVDVPAKNFDEKRARDYANKFIHFASDARKVDLYIRSKIAFARLRVIANSEPKAAQMKETLLLLIELEKDAIRFGGLDAQVTINKSFVGYYAYIDPNPDLRLHYLLEIYNAYKDQPNFPLVDKAITDLNIAEVYFEKNNHKKSYEIYCETFEKYSYLLRSQYNHYARMTELALILGEVEHAKQLLKQVFAVFLETKHESHGVAAAIVYTKYYFYTSRPLKAHKYILLGKELNSKSVYFNYEIALRMFECIYFGFKGDTGFAIDLAKKGLKFIKSRGISVKTYKKARFFNLLIAIFESNKSGSPLNPRALKVLEEYHYGYDALSGLILDKLYQYPIKN